MRVMDEARSRGARPVRAITPRRPPTCRRNGRTRLELTDEGARARHIADYIAGMTDRYALIEHAKYFKATPELR